MTSYREKEEKKVREDKYVKGGAWNTDRKSTDFLLKLRNDCHRTRSSNFPLD
jgi:hypothetical protein